jgi:hypothetical protein
MFTYIHRSMCVVQKNYALLKCSMCSSITKLVLLSLLDGQSRLIPNNVYQSLVFEETVVNLDPSQRTGIVLVFTSWVQAYIY